MVLNKNKPPHCVFRPSKKNYSGTKLTTNIADLTTLKVACDSRWSIHKDELAFIIYVDDTGFEKIATLNNTVFIFAGNGNVIQSWKNWITAENKPETPGTTGIALCILDCDENKVVFEHNQAISQQDVKLAGSGSEFAYKCWAVNQCAPTAVDTAKNEDPLSGGSTKVFEMKTQSGNANFSCNTSIYDVQAAIGVRGMVIYKQDFARVISVQEAAANDEAVKSVLDDVSANKVFACAPFKGMNEPWPQEKVDELHNVLAKLIAK